MPIGGANVAVVIPAYNEAPRIARVVAGARKTKGAAVIVVDDGSSDGTAAAARKARARVVRHRRNRGVGAALRTGFDAARRGGARIIVVMGGDDQDSGDEIPRLLKKIRNGYDFVQGSRWLPGGKVLGIPPSRNAGTRVYSAIFSILAGKRITDGTNGFRALKAGLLDGIDLKSSRLDRYELEPYLYFQALRKGFRVTEVPVTKKYPPQRRAYTKMVPFLDWWRIFRPLPMIAFGIWK